MGKYAVIIGVNYIKDPKAGLKGCCNDARIMNYIVRKKGFERENIRLLVDDDDDYPSPDHINVKEALNWLCSDREEGDIIFLHFSGHGTQIADSCGDENDDEEDNLDEAIVLEGIFLMSDDDLKQYFCKLPYGARATVVMDCCHSGSMLDGESVVIEGSKDEDSEEQIAESEDLLAVLGQGGRDYGGESENRSLPIDLISEIMSEKLGADVPPTGNGVSGAMAQLFGGSSGKIMMKYAMSLMQKQGIPEDSPIMGIASVVLGALTNSSGGGGGGGEGDPVSKLFGGGAGAFFSSLFGGGGGSGDDEPAPPIQRPDTDDDPGDSVANMMANLGLSGSMPSAAQAPAYDPMHGAVPKDVCTLVTGCQADETSADVRLANGDAFGALTKTLSDIQITNPDITNYDLVTAVRRSLSKAGYSQNPCLETSECLAREVFICTKDE